MISILAAIALVSYAAFELGAATFIIILRLLKTSTVYMYICQGFTNFAKCTTLSHVAI